MVVTDGDSGTLAQVGEKSRIRVQDGVMPTYIVFSKWTAQGLQNLQKSPSRLDAARKAYEALGVRMKDFYMVMGQYDMVAIVDAPDDTTLAKAILSSSSQGSITTETCRAFTEDEYRKVIGGLA